MQVAVAWAHWRTYVATGLLLCFPHDCISSESAPNNHSLTLEDLQARGCYCRERRVGIDIGQKAVVSGEMVCLDESGLNWIVVSAVAKAAATPPAAKTGAPSSTRVHYLGGVKSQGIRAYALYQSESWCSERVTIKVISERLDAFFDGIVKYFIEQLGNVALVGRGLCPQTTTLDVWGYVADDPKPIFHGVSSAGGDWALKIASKPR